MRKRGHEKKIGSALSKTRGRKTCGDRVVIGEALWRKRGGAGKESVPRKKGGKILTKKERVSKGKAIKAIKCLQGKKLFQRIQKIKKKYYARNLSHRYAVKILATFCVTISWWGSIRGGEFCLYFRKGSNEERNSFPLEKGLGPTLSRES